MATWTAEDWDRSDRVREMLRALEASVSDRKLRLFAVALCNRFRDLLTDPRCLAALTAAQDDAGNRLERRELRAAAKVAAQTVGNGNEVLLWVSTACAYLLENDVRPAVSMVIDLTGDAACLHWAGDPDRQTAESAMQTVRAEERFQANLLRRIVGNPFRPFTAPVALPTVVMQLAGALEAGEPAASALRDALLEAGQTELAEHFASDEPHPRGCWALDVIGGRA